MSLKRIGAVLWILVLAYGGYYVYQHVNSSIDDKPAAEIASRDGTPFDGRIIEDISWKRLTHVTPFVLTERSGQEFDSRSLAGKPYVLSFFFTTCPTICRDLNRQVGRLVNRYKDTDATFIGMSVKTKTDTPEVLRAYAESFQADPEKWLMLTGQQYKINQIATHQLNTVVDGDHHTGDIFLVDRWGRVRDRFTWDDPREMKRFDDVLRDVLAETSPPLDETIKSRVIIPSLTHELRIRSSLLPWLQDIQLTDMNNQQFFSRDLTGNVWVASFFFTRCGSICPRQNAFLSQLQPDITGRHAKLVSITTDPVHDRPEVLRPYAKQLNASDDWLFLTGDDNYVQRVGSEFLGLPTHGEHHSSKLAVIDRWGNVRGRFIWQDAEQVQNMLELIEQLNKEATPVFDFEVVEPGN